jgi:hypothetical protein
MKSRLALVIRRIDSSAPLDQQIEKGKVAPSGRRHQGGRALGIACIDISAFVE